MIPIKLDPMAVFVRRSVVDCIDNHKKIDGEAKSAIKRSSQIIKMIDNLTLQFKQVQDIQIKRGKKKISQQTLEYASRSMVDMFINNFNALAERKRESIFKKYEREHSADNEKDMESTLKGNTKGAAFEEMGLIIPEEQEG